MDSLASEFAQIKASVDGKEVVPHSFTMSQRDEDAPSIAASGNFYADGEGDLWEEQERVLLPFCDRFSGVEQRFTAGF